jgi:hypothetical protein
MPQEYSPRYWSNTGDGSVSSNRTCRSPTTTTSRSTENCDAPDFGSFGSVIRANVATTSSGVTGRPSWKVMPGRIVAVQARAPGSARTDSATAGCRV